MAYAPVKHTALAGPVSPMHRHTCVLHVFFGSGANVVYRYRVPDNRAQWDVMVDAQSAEIVQVYNNRTTLVPGQL